MPSSPSSSPSWPDPNQLWPWFVASVPDYAMLLLDHDGYILSWNRAAELISRYQPQEIVGQHFSRLYPPEDVAAGKPERELRTAAATGHLADISERRRKDGSRFLASVQLTAIRGPDHTLSGF